MGYNSLCIGQLCAYDYLQSFAWSGGRPLWPIRDGTLVDLLGRYSPYRNEPAQTLTRGPHHRVNFATSHRTIFIILLRYRLIALVSDDGKGRRAARKSPQYKTTYARQGSRLVVLDAKLAIFSKQTFFFFLFLIKKSE